MKEKGQRLDPTELRQRAKERLEERRRQPSARDSEDDLPRVVEELQIHQFELEIQNEELQRARGDLEALLLRYTDLYEFAPIGYLTVGHDGSILQANLAGAALLGAERSKLVGQRFTHFVAPDSLASIIEFLASAYGTATRQVCEASLLTATKRVLHARIEAVAYGDGQGCRVALVDISERKRAEAALETSEVRYRLLFESAHDGILLLDAVTGTVLTVNPALCRLLGQEADSLTERPLWDLDPFTALIDSRQTFLRLQSRGEIRSEHLPIETIDGRHVDVELISHTYRVARGHVMEITVRDIGPRLQAERAQAEAQQHRQLGQKLEAVGRLAGGVAHEFNNQIGVIVGYTHLLRERLAADGPALQQVEAIEKAARRSADLTRQLLAFARKQVLQPKQLAPSALVAEAVPLLSRRLGRDVAVALKLNAKGRVRVDPGQLEGVLLSLVANAGDAMPDGGAISIETDDVDLTTQDAERHEITPPARYVTLTVSDTGAGLDDKTKARIFEPFFTTKPQGQTSGLGLAAVYGTVKQSGGYLFVENNPGSGARFRIYLPREDGAAPIETAAVRGAAPVPGKLTVLLVEDEPAALDLLSYLLREEGYEVLAASDGEEALLLASETPGSIHLLLTDVVMPRLSGRELVERLSVARPGMKVLYMSGYPRDELSSLGLLDAGVALIEKPFTPEELMARLRERLASEPEPPPS